MTLVELMVTMVIASIVAASTFMFFAGQQRVYETQTKMLNVQQNVWAAMEVLSRFVRAEGSGMYGCVRPVGGIVPSPPLRRGTGIASDDSDDPPVVPAISAGVVTVHDLSLRPNAGLRAYDRPHNTTQRIPPLWIVDQVAGTDSSVIGIVPGTDVVTVAFGNRSSGTNFDSALAAAVADTNSAIITAAPNAVMFQQGEFILLVGEQGLGLGVGFVSDIGCTLLQITGVTTATNTLSHASDSSAVCPPPPSNGCTGSVWNPSGAPVAGMIPGNGYLAYVPGSVPQNPNTGVRNFGQFWWVRFAVRTKDQYDNYFPGLTQGVPVLTMERLDGAASTNGAQVLAEGIEDLQVAFACDINGNGVLDDGSPSKILDDWTLNDANDPIETSNARKCNQPSAVRLTLVARSLTEDNGIDAKATFNSPPTIENHLRPACCDPDRLPPTSTCCDQYRRRVLSTTVYPRNN
jgi:type II secretory pathway pseudopilin PulG